MEFSQIIVVILKIYSLDEIGGIWELFVDLIHLTSIPGNAKSLFSPNFFLIRISICWTPHTRIREMHIPDITVSVGEIAYEIKIFSSAIFHIIINCL
jgi:hypothetical protein